MVNTGDLGNSPIARATEGWLELFLTPSEKLSFSHWNEVVRDKSLVHYSTRSFFQYLASFIPVQFAPNLVTLSGFIILGQVWYFNHMYSEAYPTACTWVAAFGMVFFFVANSLAVPHADRTRQHTPLSDLFKYACDSGSTVWLASLTTSCLVEGGGTLGKLSNIDERNQLNHGYQRDSLEIQWYAVQAGQLILFLKHLSAFRRKAGLRYHLAAGPGEVLVICVGLLFSRGIVGKDYFNGVVDYIVHRIFPRETYDHSQGGELIRVFYYVLFVSSILQSLALSHKQHGWTKFGLILSLCMRLVPALLFQAHVQPEPVTVTDILCEGFFMSVLTCDIILAKMAGRELHVSASVVFSCLIHR